MEESKNAVDDELKASCSKQDAGEVSTVHPDNEVCDANSEMTSVKIDPSTLTKSEKVKQPNNSVSRCIYSLQKASDDNEKFAALLMVTIVIKADDLDDKSKVKLFDAIGMDFLIKMMRDDSMLDENPNTMFKSIALSILSSFISTGHNKSSFYGLIPDLMSIVEDSELQESNLTMIQDAFQCLNGISAYKSGRKAIIESGCLTSLVDLYVLENFCQDFCLKTLSCMMMSTDGPSMWRTYTDSFSKLASHISQEFFSNQSVRKFELCPTLVEILYSMPNYLPEKLCNPWQKQLHSGLSDILLSKLAKDQRYQGLHLASAALDVMGTAWVVNTGPKGHQLMLIMVHLACVEVRMSLEDETFEKIVELAPQTIPCYSILENAIKFLVNGALEMDAKQKQQLYAALKGAFHAVLNFLNEAVEEKVHTSNKPTQIFVCATIRVLGAWLAEETSANKDEVYGILPFVINVARYNFNWNQKYNKEKHRKSKSQGYSEDLPDLLKFLLPGLCHLTAEDEPLFTLLQLDIEQLLLDYFLVKWDCWYAMVSETEVLSKTTAFEVESACDTLVTICSIFMNIVVTSPKHVKTKPLYLKLLKTISIKIIKIPDAKGYILLCGNLSVLGLMILKHIFMNIKESDFGIFRFIQKTIMFLWDAHNVEDSPNGDAFVVSTKYRGHWDGLMELWYLGMHNLMMLTSQIPWLCDFLLECHWPQTVVRTLAEVRHEGIDNSVKTALEDMLCMIVRNSNPAKNTLRENNVVTVAQTHNMANLLAELNR